MKNKIYNYIIEICEKHKKNQRGGGFFILIDPDKKKTHESIELAKKAAESGVDCLLIGSSILLSNRFDETINEIKKHVSIPVIVFPGIFDFVTPSADAIFLISLISGRNPNLLIGEQVRAAPKIKYYDIETIPVAYMLIESGNLTSVEYMSDTKPIPREKNDIAISHALAAEYLGFKMIYLEAGSGAKYSVPNEMISELAKTVSLPIIVGGGIRTPEEAHQKIVAGADFVVIGSVLEMQNDYSLLQKFSKAIQK